MNTPAFSKKVLVLIIVLIILTSNLTVTMEQPDLNNQNVQKKTTVLQLAHIAANEHSSQYTALEAAGEIYSRTKGQIWLEVFGNMQFGQERDLIKMVQQGKLDLAIVTSGALSSFLDSISVLDLPYLFETKEEAYEAWDGPPGQYLFSELRLVGIEGISYWENGWRCLTSKNRPIQNVADLNDLRIRVIPNPVYISFFSQLGANPTPLEFGDLVPALQRGIVEAQENPLPVIFQGNLNKYQNFLTLTRHTFSSHIIIASPTIFDKLTRSEIAIIRDVFQNARVRQRALVTQQESVSLQRLQISGMHLVPVDLLGFRNAGKQFSRRQLQNFKPQIRNLFERYLP